MVLGKPFAYLRAACGCWVCGVSIGRSRAAHIPIVHTTRLLVAVRLYRDGGIWSPRPRHVSVFRSPIIDPSTWPKHVCICVPLLGNFFLFCELWKHSALPWLATLVHGLLSLAHLGKLACSCPRLTSFLCNPLANDCFVFQGFGGLGHPCVWGADSLAVGESIGGHRQCWVVESA